jgi:hypothetical protein
MTADSAGATKPRSLQGHGPALLSTEASGRCWFSQATFAGAHGNGRDAPIPAIRGIALGSSYLMGRGLVQCSCATVSDHAEPSGEDIFQVSASLPASIR